MSYTTLVLSIDQQIATIRLNRPDNANSMNPELSIDLMKVSIECDENPDIRAVVLTGNGKLFCAGGDLKAFSSAGPDINKVIKEMTVYLHAAISRFCRMNKPLIVAVNGPAAGAGLSLVLAGDIVIAAASSNFTMAYTAAGLSPDLGASYLLPRTVGLRRAQELILTNRRLDAEEAVSWGIATRSCADDELMETATKMADKLANGPTRAYGNVKKLLLQTYEQSLETHMELEARSITELSASQDGAEGINAFLERRKPVFSGN